MKEQLIELFNNHPQAAVLVSLGISVLVAVLGLVPSFFITAANLIFFGFWRGLLISMAGEVLGAIISFFLYRKGFKKMAEKSLDRFPKAKPLLTVKDREAFILILSLRLLPFVPSGIVTFGAAVGNVSALTFVAASSLGKIPALFLEGYSVYQVTKFDWQGKLILTLVAFYLAYLAWKQISKRKTKSNS